MNRSEQVDHLIATKPIERGWPSGDAVFRATYDEAGNKTGVLAVKADAEIGISAMFLRAAEKGLDLDGDLITIHATNATLVYRITALVDGWAEDPRYFVARLIQREDHK